MKVSPKLSHLIALGDHLAGCDVFEVFPDLDRVKFLRLADEITRWMAVKLEEFDGVIAKIKQGILAGEEWSKDFTELLPDMEKTSAALKDNIAKDKRSVEMLQKSSVDIGHTLSIFPGEDSAQAKRFKDFAEALFQPPMQNAIIKRMAFVNNLSVKFQDFEEQYIEAQLTI